MVLLDIKHIDREGYQEITGTDKFLNFMEFVKELNKTPSLQIPDKAIRLAIIQDPTETDKDEIIKRAKVLKGTMAGVTNSANIMSSLFDYWLKYSDAFNLPH